MGKGSLWRVEQQQMQNLMQALNRSPFYQNSSNENKINLKSPGSSGAAMHVGYDLVDGLKTSGNNMMASPSSSSGTNISSSSSAVAAAAAATAASHIDKRFDPRLFPNLSKAFKNESDAVPDGAEADADDDDDDDYPSDYSTLKNHQHYQYQQYATSNGHQHNHHHHPHAGSNGNNLCASPTPNSNNGNNGMVNGTALIGALSNYESMERLARDCGAESIDDVNAAAAMLALKHGPKVFCETFQNG